MRVVVPHGFRAGQVLEVEAPDGQNLRVTIPQGVKPGKSFLMDCPPPLSPEKAAALAASKASGRAGIGAQLFNQAMQGVGRVAGIPDQMLGSLQEGMSGLTGELKGRIKQELDAALASHDDSRLNRVLDAALGSGAIEWAPQSVKHAAQRAATRQMQDALRSDEPKQIKGAMIAAQRLGATELPEFEQLVQRYQQMRSLPGNWDIGAMVRGRTGSKLVSKTSIRDPAVLAAFQGLLDFTHDKVYTRDRRGQAVPDRLELLAVTQVENGDNWAAYVAQQETIRRDLASNPQDFFVCSTKTSVEVPGVGDVAATLSALSGIPPPDPALNEVLLFHGTNHIAAEKIATSEFRIRLAGSNAGTLYGRGVYFAENSSKSDEYTRPDPRGFRTLLVCRVTLGRTFYTDRVEADPRGCEDACLRGPYHSVLGDRQKARGTFREFVIFDEDQVYANFILIYKRVHNQGG